MWLQVPGIGLTVAVLGGGADAYRGVGQIPGAGIAAELAAAGFTAVLVDRRKGRFALSLSGGLLGGFVGGGWGVLGGLVFV